MIVCKCIEKIRNKSNIIIGYKLCDENNVYIDMNPNQLKLAMKSGQIRVHNLKLTEDNRIIDSKQTLTTKPDTDKTKRPSTVESVLRKSKLLGYTIEEVKGYTGQVVKVIYTNKERDSLIICIDETETELEQGITNSIFPASFGNSSSTLKNVKIIGGNSLKSAANLIDNADIDYLDLSGFKPDNFVNASNLFFNSNIRKLNFGNFNMKSIVYANYMFSHCVIDEITFGPQNKTNQYEKNLNICKLSFSNLEDATNMIFYSKMPALDISLGFSENVSSFGINRIIDGAETPSIKLSIT